MSAVSFKSINVGDNEIQITTTVPNLEKVYYIPCGLSRLLVGNIDKLFGLSELNKKESGLWRDDYYTCCPEVDIKNIRPIDKEDPRTFIIKMESGFEYIISLLPNKTEIFSELIRRRGKMVLYRDRLDCIPAIGPGWDGDDSEISDLVASKYPFNNFTSKLLFGLSPELIELSQDIVNVDIIDQANDIIQKPNFSTEDLRLVNKIVVYLFNDTVSKVYSDGSFATLGNFKLEFELGGGGYQRILHFLEHWITHVVNDNGTLIVRNWNCGLHPLLSKAIIDEILKNIETKGTLFLETYEDQQQPAFEL